MALPLATDAMKPKSGRVQKAPRPSVVGKGGRPSSMRLPLFDRRKLQLQWVSLRRVGPGLINGHNTCFLNAVLQCLTYTPPLTQYLLTEGHKNQCSMTTFCALCAMETHVRRIFEEPKSKLPGAAILPGYFTSNLSRLSKTLKLRRQEDAHEFMMFLFTAFQKASLNGLFKVEPKVEESTMLHGVFGGRLRSQVRCLSCKAESNTFQALLDLSVDIQHSHTLERALKNFIKVDFIGGKDPATKYHCSSCKKKVNAEKQMTIERLPSMLSIHLKRFTYDLRFGMMRKVTDKVEYPNSLDMAPYVTPEKRKIYQNGAYYDLYAVLVHIGHSCNSGHYFAYVKSPEGLWYRMDDEEVTKVSLKEVLSQKAYMLFYAKRTQSTAKTASSSSPFSAAPSSLSSSSSSSPSYPVKTEQDANTTNGPLDGNSRKRTASASQEHFAEKDERCAKKQKTDEAEEKPFIPGETAKVIADSPSDWFVRPSSLPPRSLRGNQSPPTFAAAVSHPSVWTIRPISEDLDDRKQDDPKPSAPPRFRRPIPRWNVTPIQNKHPSIYHC